MMDKISIREITPKKNPRTLRSGGLGWVPGSALLSHGGPHYHRRWAVSLPRSGWDRVVPARHGRQAILSPPPPLSAGGRRGAFSGRRLVVRVSARFASGGLAALRCVLFVFLRHPFLGFPPLPFHLLSLSCLPLPVNVCLSRSLFQSQKPPRPAQAAWALYGQASRAISTG